MAICSTVRFPARSFWCVTWALWSAKNIIADKLGVSDRWLSNSSERTMCIHFGQGKKCTSNYMGVSKNNGTPKSSILIGFSIIFTIHFGIPLFLETSICWQSMHVVSWKLWNWWIRFGFIKHIPLRMHEVGELWTKKFRFSREKIYGIYIYLQQKAVEIVIEQTVIAICSNCCSCSTCTYLKHQQGRCGLDFCRSLCKWIPIAKVQMQQWWYGVFFVFVF